MNINIPPELEDALTELAKQAAVEIGEFIIDNASDALDKVLDFFDL